MLLRLDVPLHLAVRGRLRDFTPGWYAYAGSANGPGGLRARLARHFRRDKAPHWHVDPLAMAAGELAAVAVPGGNECAIAAVLTGSGSFAHVHEGFGSSDCRICRSHLLAWTDQA